MTTRNTTNNNWLLQSLNVSKLKKKKPIKAHAFRGEVFQ